MRRPCADLGAYVVREALDHADDGIKTGTDWMLNQLVLIAGDIDAPDFVAGNPATKTPKHVATYVSADQLFQPLR
jgi:hypothetical protein